MAIEQDAGRRSLEGRKDEIERRELSSDCERRTVVYITYEI